MMPLPREGPNRSLCCFLFPYVNDPRELFHGEAYGQFAGNFFSIFQDPSLLPACIYSPKLEAGSNFHGEGLVEAFWKAESRIYSCIVNA